MFRQPRLIFGQYIAWLSPDCIADVADRLDTISRSIVSSGYGAVLIAVYDGAAEQHISLYEQHCSQDAFKTCAAKENEFYQICYGFLRLQGAAIVDSRARLLLHWDEKPEKYRWWQDACLAVFPGENALFTALTSTWKLHGRLRDHHEKQRLGWQFGLYATICVGTSFAAALPCLPYARRGETAIHADIADRLTPQLRQLLLAAGLRYGPASSESSSPTAIGVTGDLTCDCAE